MLMTVCCPYNALVSSDTTCVSVDVWASYTASVCVPVVILKNTLARSWLTAALLYGTAMALYGLLAV